MKKFWKILIHAPRNSDSNSIHGNNKLPFSIQNQAIVDFSYEGINNNAEKITLSKYFTLSLLGCTDKNIVHHLLFPKIIKVSFFASYLMGITCSIYGDDQFLHTHCRIDFSSSSVL